jgi:hypothetical protein
VGCEAFDIDGDAGQYVLYVGLVQAVAAAAASAGAVDEFAGGALDAGSKGIEAPQLEVVLVGTIAGLEFVQVAGEEVHGAC